MRYPGLARALVLGGTQFRFSEAYLEAAGLHLGISEGEEPDPGRLEREQPDFVAYLREAARSRLRPGVLEDVREADRGAVADTFALPPKTSPRSPTRCSSSSPDPTVHQPEAPSCRLLSNGSWPSPRLRTTASTNGSGLTTRSPWISSCSNQMTRLVFPTSG